MSYVQNGAAMKANTIMMTNGVRVNWRQVSYFTYTKTDDGFEFKVKWKYKASIRTETLILKKDFNLNSYFKQYKIVLFNDLWVNLTKIMIIEEEAIHGPEEKTKVRMVFVDGFELIQTMPADKWARWKTTYA